MPRAKVSDSRTKTKPKTKRKATVKKLAPETVADAKRAEAELARLRAAVKKPAALAEDRANSAVDRAVDILAKLCFDMTPVYKRRRIRFGSSYPWFGFGVRLFLPYRTLSINFGPWFLEISPGGE